jgi:hypothetical protein
MIRPQRPLPVALRDTFSSLHAGLSLGTSALRGAFLEKRERRTLKKEDKTVQT